MQYLKEEVRERILSAALEEFTTNGYEEASIRAISKSAQISSGNVYRYFENKDSLFEEIVGPIYEKLTSELTLIKTEVTQNHHLKNQVSINDLPRIDQSLFKIFETDSQILLILLLRSKGSKFEGLREELISLTEEILRLSFIGDPSANGGKHTSALLYKVLATTLIEGTCVILENTKDKTCVKDALNEFIQIHSLGVRHYFC